jgi:uncharacterized protein YdhG (YjbR/CyaY superfamily)
MAEKTTGLSAAEKAAMKERLAEQKAEARISKNRAEGEKVLLERIASMPEADKRLATRVHELVSQHAPELLPRTWYGMPAWTRDGKVVVFFQDAVKFESRYATLGFQDSANLDDGPMWPASFALIDITPDVEARIVALLEKAIS